MKNIQSQRFAIIDLGSNTARLVLMRAIPGYAFRLEDEIREVVRLRQGMTAEGLHEEAMARGFLTLRLFKRFCNSMKVDTILATATSAVREGANGPAFVRRVQDEIGISLRVLDGEQEAYYGTLGALNDVALAEGCVVDIGGGSAQISEVRQRRFRRGQALTLGALALTERFVQSDPISKTNLKSLQAEIDRQLDTISWLGEVKGPLVGLGGAIRNLAGIEAARQNYPLTTLHGFSLSQMSLAQSIELFRQLPLKERQNIPGLKSDRADIILAGALVIETIMKRLGAEALTVSINGLREGIFLEQFWGHLEYPVISDARRFGVLNLARVYQYHKRHANHVRYLAGRLFRQLHPLHGYGLAERELLDAAALLHDLGTIIEYGNHHKHSQTLIVTNGLPGFTPREIGLIALLARYHRSGRPDVAPYKLLCEEGDGKLLTCLAAILRLAEYLERGRNTTVDDIAVSWDDAVLHLTLIADEYPAVEMWEAKRNAVALMEEAFRRTVHLDCTAAPSEWLGRASFSLFGAE
jgi:exopolyphosphatase/guanosine-5'-triphosphate,3'-diphosphate pyrophosphatase